MISLCMIVRNEEEVLGRCLASVRDFVDEIVIVDTGSQDKTKEIASKFTSNIYDFCWEDDFAAARNFSFSQAREEYLLWLDADDVIEQEAQNRFASLKKMLKEERPDVVMCKYKTGGLLYERERILKRCPEAKWRGHVHECIVRFGKTVHADFTVTHLPTGKERGDRNLQIYLKWAQKERLSARDLFYFGRELFYRGLYVQAAATLEEMLRGEGWYVNKIEACKVLSACKWQMGDKNGAFEALFRSFLYGEPRASVLCELGKLYKETGRFREALFWFEAALRCRDHTEEGDFELPDCRTIFPTLELVALYHVLGEREKSFEFHQKSLALAPDHPSVVHNRKFFASETPAQ